MSGPIQIVAILTPKPGMSDKVIESLAPFNAHVEANEPKALQYQLFKQVNAEDGKESLVYIEIYKDKESLEAHRTSDARKELNARAAKENLLAMPPDIKVLTPIGGFDRRN